MHSRSIRYRLESQVPSSWKKDDLRRIITRAKLISWLGLSCPARVVSVNAVLGVLYSISYSSSCLRSVEIQYRTKQNTTLPRFCPEVRLRCSVIRLSPNLFHPGRRTGRHFLWNEQITPAVTPSRIRPVLRYGTQDKSCPECFSKPRFRTFWYLTKAFIACTQTCGFHEAMEFI